MRGFAASMILSLLVLTGCVTHHEAPVPTGPTAIMLERGPCFGACPTYSAKIEESGAGHYDGKRFVAISGEREFASTPETFEHIRDLLAHWHPDGEERRIGQEGCSLYATDHASWTIRWTERDGSTRSLYYDTGCHDEQYKPLAEAVRASRALLPIDALVGRRDG